MNPVLLSQFVQGATGAEVDTMIIELHDTIDPTVILFSASGILYTDGNLSVQFNNVNPGQSFWIAVKHRNSIQTWSAYPVAFSDTTNYDFTIAGAQAYGSNMIEVEPGIWAFFNADINQDEFVDSFDFSLLESDLLNFSSGYFATDINVDGFVDSFDYSIYEGNLLNFVQSVHP